MRYYLIASFFLLLLSIGLLYVLFMLDEVMSLFDSFDGLPFKSLLS